MRRPQAAAQPRWTARMRIEIHRHRMAMPPRDDGMIAVGYDVLVPEKDVLPGAQGIIRILNPGWREYRIYEG